MISVETFFDSNIKRVCEEYKTPYELTQRAIYSLGLVEALRKVGLDFVFKGGSSMMLLFKTPKRLSTDADILVSPDCDIDSYVKKASVLFPFRKNAIDITSLFQTRNSTLLHLGSLLIKVDLTKKISRD